MKPSEKTAGSWSPIYIVVILFFILTLFMYQQTVLYLNSIWSNISVGEYAHGYLVVAISAYLLYNKRNQLKITRSSPSYAVLPLLFGSVVLWLAAVIVDVEVAQALGLLLIIFTFIWALLGHAVMKQLAFPILFVGFAIPIWFPLSPLLQELSADVVFWIARLINMPAFREGSMIIIPSGAFTIEEACSGLRYLLAALTLGSLYAYLNYSGTMARIAVIFIAAAAAILSNMIRVFTIVYLGHVTEMQHPWVDDHLMLGWYLFGGLVAILLFLDTRFYKPATSADDKIDAHSIADDEITKDKGRRAVEHGFVGISAITLLILFTGPAVIYMQNNRLQPAGSVINITMPGESSGWMKHERDGHGWIPQFAGALIHRSDHVVRDEFVSFYIAYYPQQKQGVEVINDLNRITNNKIWKARYPHPRPRHIEQGDVLEQLIENGQNQRRLIWYWYNIGGRMTVNKYEAKVLQLAGVLTGRPQAYMAAASIAIDDDIEDARLALEQVYIDLQRPLAKITVTE